MNCLIKLLGQNTIFYEANGDTSIVFFYFISSNYCMFIFKFVLLLHKETHFFRFTRFWDIAWLIKVSFFGYS